MAINIKLFCEGTSIHGLAELYHAKHITWKLTWLFIVTGFSAVTGYMVYKSCHQFMYQESTTLFIPATDTDLIQQPVKFCVPHWLGWISYYESINENGQFKMNGLAVNQTTVLYSLSLLTPIYRQESFDNDTAADDLKNVLKNSKMTLNEFYAALAKPIPTSPKHFFTHKELLYLHGMYQMCYVANETQVESVLDSSRSISFFIRSFAFSQDLYDKFVNFYEYKKYVTEYCSRFYLSCYATREGVNWNYVHFPNFLVVEKFNNLHFQALSSVGEYTASLKASKHKWKKVNRNGGSCIENKSAFLSKQSCTLQCSIMEKFNNTYQECLPIEVSLLQGKALIIDKTCRYDINWISNLTVDFALAQLRDDIPSISYDVEECSAKCLDGCDKYDFDLSFSSGAIMQSDEISISTTSTTINIKYPTVEDMVILIETDSRTWEDFVGTVGGLLGVWTGASIMSLMQMFYLCCCASHIAKVADVRDSNNKV